MRNRENNHSNRKSSLSNTSYFSVYYRGSQSLCRLSFCRRRFTDDHFADAVLPTIILPTSTLCRQIHFSLNLYGHHYFEDQGVDEGVREGVEESIEKGLDEGVRGGISEHIVVMAEST